ncbi:MAG: PLP-dependent aminotransferase family protein [Drouetiella hepatica Uher 2000/2452]|jgi:DNA-binding transcriptional MocR family regulator|uniref:PLP-dependent aminotransferase family protein n=1 Tax=Drouetiella hepatica Uher 2000/2452 TaxID=904376 RepID=A0A951QD71_9CYAN|nr:PLP-dependent aminotransferase family protein [Drouetiella hepatica Uher 2000/2452]
MKVKLIDQSQTASLYEQVADRICALIREGTLQPGDRLPSVRRLHQQLSVSISTVLEAYRLLEDRGLVCVRPQSGYYVKQNLLVAPEEPDQSKPPKKASSVDNSMAFQMLRHVHHEHSVNLAGAVPSMEMLPLETLNRLMGQALRNQSVIAHSYDVPPGCQSLRHEVARRLMDAGCSITPDEIVTTNGTFEAVYLSLKAVTRPGDTVAIESPTYYGLLEALEVLHLKALELPTHPREGLSLLHLETALQKHQIAACALVSNFSNPLGSCMSDAKKKELVELMTRYDTPLIEDDIYGDLYFEGTRPKALKAFDRQGIVLYCASYSKTLSPGLRVGWSVAGRYQAKVEQLKWVINQTTAIAPQLTIAAFLSNGGYDRHLRFLRRNYQAQMAQMTQAICEYFPTETRVTRPSGGHVLWVELPQPFDAIALYHQALEQNVSIAPGAIFSPSGSYGNCLRLNSGLPWSEKIEQAMQTIGSLAKRQFSQAAV